MTPEQKAKAYAEQYPQYVIQQIAESAHLAGQQAAWDWIPITPDRMPEPNVPLQLYYLLLHKPIYGLYDGEYFFSAGSYGRLPKEYLTHFRYIPQDKPGEK